MSDARFTDTSLVFSGGSNSISVSGNDMVLATGGRVLLPDVTASGNLTTDTLTLVTPPSGNNDVANKLYVDTVAKGIKWKDSVRIATTGNITLNGEQSIDGFAATSGQRILVKDQNVASENGIYVVSTGAWSRADDFDTGSNASGAATLIIEGVQNGETGWLCNNEPNTGTDVVGTDDLTYIQFSGPGVLEAGSGIAIASVTISAKPDDSTINFDGSAQLQLKDLGVSASKLAASAVTTAKIADAAVTNAKLANDSLTVSAGDGLGGGGAVALGGSVALGIDATVLRSTGDQSLAGVQSVTNATASSSASTGALVVTGGLGLGGALYSSGRIQTSDTIQGSSITDGAATLTSGSLSGLVNTTASGTATAGTFTDGTLSINTGAVTGAVSIATGSVTATGAVTGGSVTDGTATLSSGVLSGLLAPSGDTEAANKAYVDSAATGLKWKDPALAASTGALTLSGEQTVDGVALVSGDRVLVKDQASASENGLYVVSTGAWARASDMPASASAAAFAVLVTSGSTYAATGFTVTASSPFTVGTSDITWTQFSSAGTVSAGAGLSKSGNTLSASVDNATMQIAANQLAVKTVGAAQLATGAVTTLKIADAAVTNAKMQNDSVTIAAGDGLSGGGAAALGGSASISVDSTVLRTTGNQAASGVHTFSNATQSLSAGTGAVVVSGGLGVAKDVYTGGKIVAAGPVTGSSVGDGTAVLSAGALTGLNGVGCTSLTASGTVTAATLTDTVASLSAGSWTGLVNTEQSGTATFAAIPGDRVLYTTTGGVLSSSASLTWDGTDFSANRLNVQNIARPAGTSTAGLWTTGTGNINIGTASTGILQFGATPYLRLNPSNSIFASDLVIKGGLVSILADSSVSTAGNVAYTAQQLLDGLINRDCNGANRTDTTPSAADIVALIPEVVVGSSFEFTIRNQSAALETLSIVGGTGVTVPDSLRISKGNSSKLVVRVTNTAFGNESVSMFAAVPKDRVMIQCSFSNPTSGGNAVVYANWGPVSTATVDSTVLGYSGRIVQLVASYSSSTPLGLGTGESLTFDIGTANADLDTFTAFSGGTNLIQWTNAEDGTKPSTSSGPISLVFSSTDRLAVRSTENGTVTPTTSEVRCILTLEVD